MFNLLTYLNIKFEYHMRPDWGKYEFNGKIKQAEYDFTIQNKNIIIEMDGSFHYDVISYGDNNTKEIDEYKNTLALCNNYHIIRVDCNYDFNIKKFEYIKNNIIKSLNNIIDLSVVDWDYIERKSFESLLIKACKMWENGMTTQEISNSLSINTTSIIEYLKRGNNAGLCWYSKEISNLRQAKKISSKYYNYCAMLSFSSENEVKDINGTFYDIDNFIYNYKKIYGKSLKKQSICNTLNGKQKYMHGAEGLITFKYISKEEYEALRTEINIINDMVDIGIPIVQSSVDYSNLYNMAIERKNKKDE